VQKGEVLSIMDIGLLWTEEVDGEVVVHLREHLGKIFSCPVQGLGEFALKPEEYRPDRRQYRSTPILARLHPLRPPGGVLLAVTGSDLFAGGFNFVFGEADAGRGCAIISLARLGLPPAEGKPAAVLFRRRTLTEAVHEIGHLLGLGHCPKEDCVMHFSNSLADTDRKSPEFCKRCRDQLPVT
jgi:archaemetzincin